MSEPRRSTRARAREDAAPAAPDTPNDKPAKAAKAALKRKRTSLAVKDAPPSTPVAEGAPLPPRQTLPLQLVDGAPLPTLREPQPLHLPSSEWQTIQQSRVLETSFERSKAVWLSGANFRTFHAHFNQPKKLADRTDEDKAKTARQKELLKNFPQVGADRVSVKLVIEPHTLPIRLYGPREVGRPAQKKPPAPSPYAPWPNHNQPNQHTKYQGGQPIQQKPQPRPPQPPKPVQAAPPPQAPAAPAPDPVIHMLAARAGTDPELKAVMKIVAAGSASKEQLEFFQTHINELTAILARQKEEKAPKPTPPTQPPKSTPPPPAPKHTAPPPLPRPVQPVQQPLQPSTPKPYSPVPPQGQMQQPSPTQQPYPPYPNNFSKPPQYHPPPQLSTYNPPPRTTYRPLVFSFVHGSEDKFYFPSYSFMEWLPNGTGAKLSFLITKMKPRPDPVVKPPSASAQKSMPTPIPTLGTATNAMPDAPPPNAIIPTPSPTNPAFASIQPAASAPSATFVPPKPPQRIEDFDEMNEIDNIEFYQPVTVLLLIEHDEGDEIASALPRSIRPPHVVDKYMNEVFDKCKRAEETYLAFRLPKDGDELPEKRIRSGDVTPAVATPTQDVAMGGMVLRSQYFLCVDIPDSIKYLGSARPRPVTEIMPNLKAIFTKAYWTFAILGIVWAAFVGLLVNPTVQRHALYAHKFHTGFYHNVTNPEEFGFAKGQVQPFWLTTADQEKLFCWHVLPLDVYLENEHELFTAAVSGEVAEELKGTIGEKLLSSDPESRVVVNFHGNAGHIAQGYRPSTYRSVSGIPKTHLVTCDYRGFGLSTLTHSPHIPTESGLIADALSLISYITSDLSHSSTRTVLLGQSLGTAVTAASALYFTNSTSEHLPLAITSPSVTFKPSRNFEGFAGIVLVAPFTSLPQLLKTYKIGGVLPILKPLQGYPRIANYLSTRIVDHWPTLTRLRALISTASANKSGFHITLLHARNDQDITYWESEALFQPLATQMLTEEGVVAEEERRTIQGANRVKRGAFAYKKVEDDKGDRMVELEVVRYGGHNEVVGWTQVSLAIRRAFVRKTMRPGLDVE
ncbi:uncharacterized protein J4E78_007565 [Alternaria triticimaculans]|uniref:uncharacterized protein n=1 Tax=Alternaria triticimaculans TaxID=297637 RepID=UPI0020C504B2|nr:uncharacterized protein J4E78_007565 [Alternaria triticimaculans]KAI4652738.1 hypothetical protein J4E78_007565 [Alternaria triticimaculans]